MLVTCGATPNSANGTSPLRFPTDRDTHIAVQVRNAANIFLGTDQNEVQTPGDGIMLTQTATATPFKMRVRGLLWYSASVSQAQFVVITLAVGRPDCQS